MVLGQFLVGVKNKLKQINLFKVQFSVVFFVINVNFIRNTVLVVI